jgi:hypothetical protein
VSGKSKKRRSRPSTPRPRAAEVEVAEERASRRPGLFGGAMLAAGDSPLPSLGRSLGRGFLAVITQPLLVAVAIVLAAAIWLVLVALGFEGAPSRLADALALPPISTYFDLGTGVSLFGLGTSFLIYLGVASVIRALVTAIVAGLIVESIVDGRTSRYGALLGLRAVPTQLAVQLASISFIFIGQAALQALGPGIGFLGSVAALVGGLFFTGFAPTAAIREGRGVVESLRRSGRAAMLPGGRHLTLCALYFILALPVALLITPGNEITANPPLASWIAVFAFNVLHLVFMATFAYRWIVAEPNVPDQPVPRRQPPRGQAARARGRR